MEAFSAIDCLAGIFEKLRLYPEVEDLMAEKIFSIDPQQVLNLMNVSSAPLLSVRAEKAFKEEKPTRDMMRYFGDTWWKFALGSYSFSSALGKICTVYPDRMFDYQSAMLDKAVVLFQLYPLELLIRILDQTKVHTVLDIGGGLGFYSAMFSVLGREVSLIEKPDTQSFFDDLTFFHHIYFEKFPVEEYHKKYDCVFLSEVLHGRSAKEQAIWINRIIYEYLTENGIVIVNEVRTDPTGRSGLYPMTFDTRLKVMGSKGVPLPLESLLEMIPVDYHAIANTMWGGFYYQVIIGKS